MLTGPPIGVNLVPMGGREYSLSPIPAKLAGMGERDTTLPTHPCVTDSPIPLKLTGMGGYGDSPILDRLSGIGDHALLTAS